MCWLLQYAKGGESRAGQCDNVDRCESEDDLIEVDDVINDVFGTSTKSDSDGEDNEKDDTSTFEANSGTDINTSDDDMEIDIW